MNTMTSNSPAAVQNISLNEGYFSKRNWLDWLFAAAVVCGGLYVFSIYGGAMDVYEKGILVAAMPSAMPSIETSEMKEMKWVRRLARV